MVYRPSMSVDVAPFSASPTCTTIDTPGSGSRPLVTRPATLHDGAADEAGAGCCPAGAPAEAPTTPAAAKARQHQRRALFMMLGTLDQHEIRRDVPGYLGHG